MSFNPNSEQVDRGSLIPTKILEQNLLSPTSEAYRCFTAQMFSGNLQAFLIGYVMSVSSEQAVYS